MERILGGQIGKKGKIPGVDPGEAESVRYVSLDAKASPKKDFRQVTRHVDPPIPSSGAVMVEPCVISTPSGTRFYALYFHGDVKGWQRQIEAGAEGLGRISAKIEGNTFVCSDGQAFALAECEVKFSE